MRNPHLLGMRVKIIDLEAFPKADTPADHGNWYFLYARKVNAPLVEAEIIGEAEMKGEVITTFILKVGKRTQCLMPPAIIEWID